MSKERLEEIEEAYRLSHKHIGAYVSSEGIEWLIEYAKEQAERVQYLKIMLKILGKKNERYREAIEFGIEYLKNSDIRQVQLVVTALKSALEGDK